MASTTSGDLIKVIKPFKYEKRWHNKYYIGRLYLVWSNTEVELRKHFRTATQAWEYSMVVRYRFLRMYTPEETSQ